MYNKIEHSLTSCEQVACLHSCYKEQLLFFGKIDKFMNIFVLLASSSLPCIACGVESNSFQELKSHYDNTHPDLVNTVDMEILTDKQYQFSNLGQQDNNQVQNITEPRDNCWPNITNVLSNHIDPSTSNTSDDNFCDSPSQSNNRTTRLTITCKRDTLSSNMCNTQVIQITAKMATYYLCCNTG